MEETEIHESPTTYKLITSTDAPVSKTNQRYLILTIYIILVFYASLALVVLAKYAMLKIFHLIKRKRTSASPNKVRMQYLSFKSEHDDDNVSIEVLGTPYTKVRFTDKENMKHFGMLYSFRSLPP